jgi:hypothetical protein
VDQVDRPFSCETFAWMEAGDFPASLSEQRLRAEVTRSMLDKGYREDAESPDCLVSAVIFTGVRPSSPASVGVGMGRWGGSFGTSVGVSVPVGGGARQVGNLAVDVIEVASNAEVWRSTLEGAFPTPEPGTVEIEKAVQRALGPFPPRFAR